MDTLTAGVTVAWALEMAEASNVAIELWSDELPLYSAPVDKARRQG